MSTAPTTDLITESLKTADRLKRHRERLLVRIGRVDARINRLQNARLLGGTVFTLAILLAALKPGWAIPGPAAVIFAPVFAWLVVLTRRWTAFRAKLQRLEKFNGRHEARARGEAPETGNELETEGYGRDLDFFGHASLWTLIDETITDEGTGVLRSWITSPSGAHERQETVRSLRPLAWFYSKLTLFSDRSAIGHSSKQVLQFVSRSQTSKSFNFAYVAALAAWVIWIGLLIAGTKIAWLVWFVYIAIKFSAVGRSGDSFKAGVGASEHLSLLAPIFESIERRTSDARNVAGGGARALATLKTIAPTLSSSHLSQGTRRLNFAVGVLSLSSNAVVHIFLNLYIPWTATGLFLLERARKQLESKFAPALAELAHLEALFSLVLLDKYQTRSYPSLESDRIESRGLFHPLVKRDRVVANDFGFALNERLGLLTGSNMSGKSTFLRTIGMNQALANMGAPVFATEMKTKPLAIESCIEVSDSLRDGFSYFYAEVRRLKALLDVAAMKPTLYLIDEIFRGTNNRERQIGSRAVIQALSKDQTSQGFVSTHDLELTSLANQNIVNLHFREQIENGKMSFAYKLQPGASPTTNALRIMQLEGLPVDAEALKN